MAKIAVIVRVYNRLLDLEYCIQSIRRYWIRHDYHVILVSNGEHQGFEIPSKVKEMVDEFISLPENAGHLKGNSQLLQAGVKRLSPDYPATVILEADTWLLDDAIIDQYFQRMQHEKAVWCSAEWLTRHWSVALDIAIIDTRYLLAHPGLLDYGVGPEKTVCNYLREHDGKFIYIQENMPVHCSKTVRNLFLNRFSRLNTFLKSKMLTHHVEELPGGMEQKKFYANLCLGLDAFETSYKASPVLEKLKIYSINLLIRVIPNSSWLKKKR